MNKKLGTVALGKFIPAIGAILFNIYVGVKISPAKSDQFFLWFAIIYFASIIGRLGYDTYILRDLSNGRVTNFQKYKSVALLFSLLIAGGCIFFAPYSVWGLVISLPMMVSVGINSAILRALGKNLISGLLEVSAVSFLALFFILSGEVFGLVISVALVSYSFAFAGLTILSIGNYFIGKSVWVLKIKDFRSGDLVLGCKFMFTPLILYATQWIAVIYLTELPEGAVSIYSVGIRLASGFAFIAIAIDSYVSTEFSRHNFNGNYEKINELFKLVRFKSISLAFPIFFFYVVAGICFSDLLVRVDYMDSFYISIIVSFSYLIRLAIGPHQFLLLMTGHEESVNKSSLYNFIIVILGMTLLWSFSVTSILAYAFVVTAGRVFSICMMRSTVLNKFEGKF